MISKKVLELSEMLTESVLDGTLEGMVGKVPDYENVVNDFEDLYNALNKSTYRKN